MPIAASVAWAVPAFPRMDDADVRAQVVTDAVLSRAESGPIYWTEPSPRTFMRGAVYDSRGRLVEGSQRRGGVDGDLVLTINAPHLGDGEQDDAHAQRVIGRWLYVGHWMHGFGHFLVETLPMLWPTLHGDRFDGIVAHRFTSRKRHIWQDDLVRLTVGDLPVRVIDDAPLTVRELIVPSRLYHYQQEISPLAVAAWDRVAATSDSRTGRPVYLSRTAFERSRQVTTGREFANAEKIDLLFAERGYTVLHPETMTVNQQIEAVRAAPVIAGQAGSALHLAVFARPGTRVLELADARTRTKMVPTQQAIAAVKGQPVAVVPFVDDGAGGMEPVHVARTLDELLS